ncbi:hypothetical protein ECE50_011985 [Chitinophaga sp. Mgbs1]|uniref:Uncharacterized protein n=1 Tax=Chitinophaga solisilvae TaxID=1233460 RepID=A0A9Q5D6S1_9BACT|nr:hypothetical protein [Chitinophaga solisilvae]
MMSWNYIVPVCALLLLLVLAAAEVRRPRKSRLAARLVATTIAVVCAVLLILPLSSGKKMIVPDTATGIVKPVEKKGIIACNWPLQLVTGHEWIVQGTYRNTLHQKVWLRLSAFDTELDSLQMPAAEAAAFTLRATPLHRGRAVYRITAMAGSDTLEQQQLPLEVMPLTPMAILFLAASPDFDNRFLADWLSAEGNAVAMRTGVSRDKYATRFSNFPQQSLEQLSPALLDKFDVVIADAAAVTAATRQYLERAGIGLILKGDSAGTHPRPASLWLPGNRPLGSLLLDPATALRVAHDALPLVQDSLRQTYAAVSLAGAGKLVRTQVFNTYAWLLGGQAGAYRRYWSALLEAAARKKQPAGKIIVSPLFPQIHQPMEVQLETKTAPLLRAGNTRLYPEQDPFLPHSWKARYWPAKTGWQLLQSDSVTQWTYIYNQDEWRNMQNITSSLHTAATAPLRTNTPLPRWWWIIPLFAALAFLWWEQKL